MEKILDSEEGMQIFKSMLNVCNTVTKVKSKKVKVKNVGKEGFLNLNTIHFVVIPDSDQESSVFFFGFPTKNLGNDILRRFLHIKKC